MTLGSGAQASQRHRTIKRIGLVGGIGAGKSTVARTFATLGCVVSDSDTGAKGALKRPEVKATLRQWWGGGIFDAQGEVDRAAVAKKVFADPTQRKRLEGLIHPILHEERERLIADAETAGVPAVIIDAPLLLEVGLDKQCDLVVFVDAPLEVRFARVESSRKWAREEFARREAAQRSVADKRAAAGAVIVNDGVADLPAQCLQVLRSLGVTGPT